MALYLRVGVLVPVCWIHSKFCSVHLDHLCVSSGYKSLHILRDFVLFLAIRRWYEHANQRLF